MGGSFRVQFHPSPRTPPPAYPHYYTRSYACAYSPTDPKEGKSGLDRQAGARTQDMADPQTRSSLKTTSMSPKKKQEPEQEESLDTGQRPGKGRGCREGHQAPPENYSYLYTWEGLQGGLGWGVSVHCRFYRVCVLQGSLRGVTTGPGYPRQLAAGDAPGMSLPPSFRTISIKPVLVL